VPLLAVRAIQRALVPGAARMPIGGPGHECRSVWTLAPAQDRLAGLWTGHEDQAATVFDRPSVVHGVVEETLEI
jgi:hypothetical protein